MHKVQINDLGWDILAGSATPKRTIIPVKDDCYGVRIGADSELDQCLLVLPGASADRYHGETQRYDSNVAAEVFWTSSAEGSPSIHKLSVDRPFTGFVAKGGEIQISPSRAVRGRASTSGRRFPRLSLDYLTHATEAMWHPARRAPMDLDATIVMDADAGSRFQFVPVFGRRYASIEVAVQETAVPQWSIDGLRDVWDEYAGGFQTILIPVVATVSGAGNWEGEVECDYLRITWGLDVADLGVANMHIRAED